MRYLSNLFCFVFRSQRRTITLKKSECPVCQSLVPVHLMTSHVDSCLEPKKKVTTKIQLLFYFSISWFCRLVFQTLTRFWIRICFIYLLLEIRELSFRLISLFLPTITPHRSPDNQTWIIFFPDRNSSFQPPRFNPQIRPRRRGGNRSAGFGFRNRLHSVHRRFWKYV